MPDQILKNALNDFILVRKKNFALIDSFDESQAMIVPTNYSNNLFWQTGHLITVQASLLYHRTGYDHPLDPKYLAYFGKGTSPDDFDRELPDFKILKEQLNTMLEYTESNLSQTSGLKYTEEIQVSFGHKIKNFSDALCFLPIHEAHHHGAITMLRKTINHGA